MAVAAKTVREFQEWLNARRDWDVSRAFHDIVILYTEALAEEPPKVGMHTITHTNPAPMLKALSDLLTEVQQGRMVHESGGLMIQGASGGGTNISGSLTLKHVKEDDHAK